MYVAAGGREEERRGRHSGSYAIWPVWVARNGRSGRATGARRANTARLEPVGPGATRRRGRTVPEHDVGQGAAGGGGSSQAVGASSEWATPAWRPAGLGPMSPKLANGQRGSPGASGIPFRPGSGLTRATRDFPCRGSARTGGFFADLQRVGQTTAATPAWARAAPTSSSLALQHVGGSAAQLGRHAGRHRSGSPPGVAPAGSRTAAARDEEFNRDSRSVKRH